MADSTAAMATRVELDMKFCRFLAKQKFRGIRIFVEAGAHPVVARYATASRVQAFGRSTTEASRYDLPRNVGRL